MSDGIKIFRWRAVGPLLVLFVITCVLWWLFADTIARHESQRVGTTLLGAKVEIQSLHLDLAHGDVTITGLTIASQVLRRNGAELHVHAPKGGGLAFQFSLQPGDETDANWLCP